MNEKATKAIGVVIGIAAVVALISLGMRAQQKHDTAYPWKASFSKVTDAGTTLMDSKDVKTLEECRAWVGERAADLGYGEDQYDYSCGTGCTFDDDTVVSGKKVKTYSCTEITK